MSTVKDLRHKVIDKLNIFTKEDLAKEKVLNTLNILSGQKITETELYKTMLTANETYKQGMIALSTPFAGTFSSYGILLKTTNIYMWLEVLFDRFKAEEGIDMKKYLYTALIHRGFKDISIGMRVKAVNTIKEIKDTQLLAHEYATTWYMYIGDPEVSNLEKISKIIQPHELFIITAITTMTILCQIDQRPFEYYANMDFKTVVNTLMGYLKLNSFVYNEYKKFENNDITIEYAVLNTLVNGKDYTKSKTVSEHASNGRFMDEAFGKIIQVSEKSEYEKLKTLYKK